MALSLLLVTIALGGCGYAVDQRASQREAAAEAEYPPTGRLIRVGGRTVHAHVEGQGPDLVLIHGASGNTRDFTFSLVDRLKGEFRVTVLDRPGMGWSEDLGRAGISPLVQADHLIAASRELGLRRPLVLGHSYGAAVALAWALRDPGNTAGLVILSGATMPWPGGLGPQYAVLGSDLGGAAVVPLVTAFAREDQAQRVIASIFEPQVPPPGYAEYVGAALTLRRDSLRVNARQVGGLKPYLAAMQENYPRLTLPVEIMHGGQDTIVPPEVHALPLSRLLPNAELTLLPGIGHMPHHADEAAVVAAIGRVAARAGLR